MARNRFLMACKAAAGTDSCHITEPGWTCQTMCSLGMQLHHKEGGVSYHGTDGPEAAAEQAHGLSSRAAAGMYISLTQC